MTISMLGIFVIVLGIVVMKVGSYYFYKGKGYSPSAASTLATHVSLNARSTRIDKAYKSKKYKDLRSNKNIILGLSIITLGILVFFSGFALIDIDYVNLYGRHFWQR